MSHLYTVLPCLLGDCLSQSQTDSSLDASDQDLLDQHAADLVQGFLLPDLMESLVAFAFAELGEQNAVFGIFTIGVVGETGGCCVDLLLNDFAQVVAKRIDGGSWIRAGRAGKGMSVEGKTRRGEISTVTFLWLRGGMRLLGFGLRLKFVGW